MGTQTSKSSSIIDTKYLKSLSLSTPLKNVGNDETQVHQINSLSSEHQQIMLDKIRVKKNYDCPYLVKIIDSHTLESKNLCSTVIKTYIVVEKPQSLSDEINQRIELNIGFQQPEIWTLIYSCCLGASFLLKNNVALARLTTGKIFIDIKGAIKINDPDFCQSSLLSQRITESEYIQNLSQISRQLMKYKNNNYSRKLVQLIQNMSKPNRSLDEIQSWIRVHYLDSKRQSGTLQLFSSSKKSLKVSKSKSKSKKLLKVTSGKKVIEDTNDHKLNEQFSQSILTRFFNKSTQNWSQNKENISNTKNQNLVNRRDKLQLFTFKDPMKQFQNIDKQLSLNSHLFPRKVLFGNKRRNQKQKQTTVQQYSIPMSVECPYSTSSQKQALTRQSKSNSRVLETEQSLDSSQMINIISYQVDQQTYVRQVCQQQSQYFLQLMNQCKNSAKNYRSQ